MLYLSIALFVLAALAAMLVFMLHVSAAVIAVVEMVALALLGASLLTFAIDRAWGAFTLRRAFRVPSQTEIDLERGEHDGMIVQRPWSTRAH